MDKAREKFIKDRESKHNGKIVFSTFAKFIGEGYSKKILNSNGILYIIGDFIYFEDFEPQKNILTMYNDKDNYEKFEFSILLSSIINIKEIRDKDAINSIMSSVSQKDIDAVPMGIRRFFIHSVVELEIVDKAPMFLDFLKNSECIQDIKDLLAICRT